MLVFSTSYTLRWESHHLAYSLICTIVWLLKPFSPVIEPRKSHGISHQGHRALLTVHCFCLQSWWVMLDNLVYANTNSQGFSWLSLELQWLAQGCSIQEQLGFDHIFARWGGPLSFCLSRGLCGNRWKYRLPPWFMCIHHKQIFIFTGFFLAYQLGWTINGNVLEITVWPSQV